MPLSEDEQRILSEIETQLRASDPDLAHQVGSTTVYTESLRKLRWGIVAFIAGLVLAIVLLSVNFVLAFVVGFLGMVASALFIERNARRLGRAGINEATQAMRGGSSASYFDRAGQKARDRMRRNDESADAALTLAPSRSARDGSIRARSRESDQFQRELSADEAPQLLGSGGRPSDPVPHLVGDLLGVAALLLGRIGPDRIDGSSRRRPASRTSRFR